LHYEALLKQAFHVRDYFKFLILLLSKWVLVGKPEGKRPLGRPKRRWEDNIKKGLQEGRWRGMDWIDLAQDRDRWRALVNVVMNLRVP
jgi:hypothetical protein